MNSDYKGESQTRCLWQTSADTQIPVQNKKLVMLLFLMLENVKHGKSWEMFFYMLLEELFLSFRLVEKLISRPVSGCQSSESFLQVVVFLEALDDVLKLFLPSLNWSKSAGIN